MEKGKSKFDTMFSAALNEESLPRDTNPLENTGDGAFDDDKGDFPKPEGDDDAAQEVDVATEMRELVDAVTEILDRMTNMAEQLGGFKDEEKTEGEPTGDEMGGDGVVPTGESVEAGKLKPQGNKNAKLQSKCGMKVKTKIKVKSGKATSALSNPSDGNPKPFGKTGKELMDKGHMKVPGKASEVGKSIFD